MLILVNGHRAATPSMISASTAAADDTHTGGPDQGACMISSGVLTSIAGWLFVCLFDAVLN